jgi:hypothetical protein
MELGSGSSLPYPRNLLSWSPDFGGMEICQGAYYAGASLQEPHRRVCLQHESLL